MSDKGNNPFERLQEQIEEAIRKGNFQVHPVGFQPQGESEENADEPSPEEEKPADDEVLRRIREFNLKPRDIRDHLNRYVIKQDEAKKVLSVSICDHFNHVRRCLEDPGQLNREYSKQNILLLGPTGVGKTYLMRNIARMIGVPFAKADATKFSETGYVGQDVEDLVRDLVKVANGNTELAQYGIVYIDEIDKIAGASNMGGGKDVSGRGVQTNLLKLMEETEVSLFSPNDIMGQMKAMMGGRKDQPGTINTRHILFIVSGAFEKLAETVKKRVQAAPIGFAAEPELEESDKFSYLREASTQDFIDYGFEPEFIGRVPVRVSCESLRPEDLALVLTSSEGSLLRQYRDDFKGYGIEFEITPEAINEVAERAYHERTGARGLMTVLERLFRDYKFELPSAGITSFEVTTDVIQDPEGALKGLLVEHSHLRDGVWRKELEAFADSFEREHGFRLTFTDEAADQIFKDATAVDKTVRTVCDNKFRDFEHGLLIISRNTGQTKFEIDAAAARNPDEELSRWVVEAFRTMENEKAAEGKQADEDENESSQS